MEQRRSSRGRRRKEKEEGRRKEEEEEKEQTDKIREPLTEVREQANINNHSIENQYREKALKSTLCA